MGRLTESGGNREATLLHNTPPPTLPRDFFRGLAFSLHSKSLRPFVIRSISPSLGDMLLSLFKGLLKYLVAKLHGCYPNAISLPVSQIFFARFFWRRSVAESSCRNFVFTLLQQTQEKLFVFIFYWLIFCFTVTTCDSCLYLWKLECFAWKCMHFDQVIHVRT